MTEYQQPKLKKIRKRKIEEYDENSIIELLIWPMSK